MAVKEMTVKEAISKIREYWPDSKQIMWGDALDVICKAAESFSSASESSCIIPCSHKFDIDGGPCIFCGQTVSQLIK